MTRVFVRRCAVIWCLGVVTHLLYLVMFGSVAIGISATIAGPFTYRGYPEIGPAFSGVFTTSVYLHSALVALLIVCAIARVGSSTKLAFGYLVVNVCFCCSLYAGYQRIRPLMRHNHVEVLRVGPSERHKAMGAAQVLLENGFQVGTYATEDRGLVLIITIRDGYNADRARQLIENEDDYLARPSSQPGFDLLRNTALDD